MAIDEINTVTLPQSPDKTSHDATLLIVEDTRRSQEAAEEMVSNVCQQLKATDVRAYGRFLKRIRHILGDETDATAGEDNPYREAAGIMKDNPIWPEITELIENQIR